MCTASLRDTSPLFLYLNYVYFLNHFTMKHKLYSLFLTALLGLPGTNAWAQTTYEIGTAQDLVAFAEAVKGGETGANAVLTADITLSEAWTVPIGVSNGQYTGTFDGQGHKITGFEATSESNGGGFFGYANGATIKNFSIDGKLTATGGTGSGVVGWATSCTISEIHSTLTIDVPVSGVHHVAGVVGSAQGSNTITGCTFAGTMSVEIGSTDNFAGIAAYLRGDDSVLFCANYGTITFSDISCTAGGIVGYINNATSFVKGCLNTGSLIFNSESGAEPNWGGAIVGRLRTHDAAKLTGNYWLEGSATGGTKDNTLASAVCFTADQLPTGEVCYGLNGDQSEIGWYQTIGTDDAPVLDATHAQVYLNAHLHCNGEAYEGYSFSNTNQENIRDEHDFVDGFCSYCHLFDENFLTPNADGYYEIGNASQFIWFASKVNAGAYNANAILIDDIDMTDADISVFPIGTGGENDGKRYVGTFDGQGHRFSNFLLVNPSAANNFGIFNTYTGVVLKNFGLDNTCGIEGKELVGIVGRHDGGGTFEGVGNCANVTGKNNNIGGFFGGVFGAPSNKQEVIIKNCWTTGTILTTNTSASNYKDCGALSGWFNNAIVTIEGFWTIAEVTNPKADNMYVYRNGNGASFTIKNCFSKYGAQSKFQSLTDEQLASGEIAWKLNGESFVDAVWRQDLKEDEEFPMPFGKGPVVYQVLGDYECVSPDDPDSFDSFRNAVVANEEQFLEDVVAYQALTDDYKTAVESWEDIDNFEDFMVAYKASSELKEGIQQSATNYANYIKACESAAAYLEENALEGPWCDFLKTYLEEASEPSTDYPNGTFPYITDYLNLDDEALVAEIAFVNQMLENAIAGGVTSGTDITRLLANSTFADGVEGWETESEGTAITTGGVKEVMPIARGLGNGTFSIYQTLSDMPNGIYMMTANGMFRSGADVTTQFYAGQLFVNGTANYFMSPGEDVISKEDAEPGVNCLGEGGDAEFMTEDTEGWVPKSINGCSYAYSAGRYQNFCAGEVTDGNLMVGVRSLGTGMDSDWLPFGNVHVYYLGTPEEANEKLSDVLAAYKERAQVIMNSPFSDEPDDFMQYPNFSEELKDDLSDAIANVDGAATGEEKMALLNTFSALFNEIHACRKAYIAMYEAANKLFDFLDLLVSIELITPEELDGWDDLINETQRHFAAGDISTEEALALAKRLNILDEMLPCVDGVYQIATVGQLKLFSATVNTGTNDVKAVLTADIDMSEVESFEPIGTATTPFKGEFDGQGHKITGFGLYDEENDEYSWNLSGDNQGFFGYASGATIKNFSIEGAFTYNGGTGVGVIGLATGTKLINIHSALNIVVMVKSQHIGGVCGHLSENSSATNCSFSGTIKETADSHDCIGGIAAYSNNGVSYTNCANYGTIEFTASSAYAGGICGYVNNNSFTGVFNCLNMGAVVMANGTAPDYGGAIIGRLRDHANSKFENNFLLQGSASKAYGENTAPAETVNAEQLASGEVCYKLNGEQTEINWFQTLGEDEYPVLNDEHKVVYKAQDGSYTNEYVNIPDGSKENPFVVKSAADLAGLLNQLVSGRMNYVVMEDDVDMAGVEDWTPLFNIPDQSNGYPFIDFDGKGHVIRNLASKTEGAYDYCGLFGVLCGNVRNLGVENADVTCAGGTGILAGYLGHSTYGQTCYVENVWVTGKLTASGYCGALFGNVANESHITNCYANVEVTGSSDLTGGIIGRVRAKIEMNQVYAAGTINRGGGIIGGGQQDATPFGSYNRVAVWNNTENNFGPVREGETLTSILYYDGSNFADLQSQVVAWDPEVWACDMKPGSYPVLKAFAGNNGDLNGDGKVDIADAVTVLNAMAGDEPDTKYDVNSDGKVDIADFVTILNIMAAQ